MTETPVLVKVGVVATDTVQPISNGTTIYNNSSTDAVWISANPAMSIGNGLRIGPKGSVTWTNGQSRVWAIVEGSADVLLSLSDNAINLDNPVDVGAAIAAQLLVSGIPNVLRSDLLTALNPFFAGTNYQLNGLDKYASLILQLSGTLANVRLDFHAETPFNAGNFTTRENYTNIAGDAYTASWQIPLSGSSVDIRNNSVNSAGIAIYGTNRQVTGPRQLGQSNQPRSLNFTGSILAGTDTPLVVNDGALTRATTFNGLCTWFCTPNTGGLLRATYLDPTGTLQTYTVVTAALAANVTASGTFAHPLCPVYWSYRAGAANAAASIPFILTQN